MGAATGQLRSGKTLAVAVLCCASGIAACGDTGTRVHCVIGVVWQGQEYRQDAHTKLPRGPGLGKARELCSPLGEFADFDIQRLKGVPPELALAVREGDFRGRGIYLAMGYPVAVPSHPLYNEYFKPGRPRRIQARTCSRTFTMRGVVFGDISVSPGLNLRLPGPPTETNKLDRYITFHSGTRFELHRNGHAFIPEGARVEIRGRKCPSPRDAPGKRFLHADVIRPG